MAIDILDRLDKDIVVLGIVNIEDVYEFYGKSYLAVDNDIQAAVSSGLTTDAMVQADLNNLYSQSTNVSRSTEYIEKLVAAAEKADIGNILLKIDAVTSFKVNVQKVVSNMPVERGTTITDNSVIKPLTVSLSGIITEDTADLADFMSDISDTGNELIASANDIDIEETLNPRIRRAKEFLNASLSQDSLLYIKNGVEVYTNLSVTAINVKEDVTSQGGLFFSMSLVEVVIVSEATYDTMPDIKLFNFKQIPSKKKSKCECVCNSENTDPTAEGKKNSSSTWGNVKTWAAGAWDAVKFW